MQAIELTLPVMHANLNANTHAICANTHEWHAGGCEQVHQRRDEDVLLFVRAGRGDEQMCEACDQRAADQGKEQIDG